MKYAILTRYNNKPSRSEFNVMSDCTCKGIYNYMLRILMFTLYRHLTTPSYMIGMYAEEKEQF
jgi:hypothetical protein